jgi:hypothetical protein
VTPSSIAVLRSNASILEIMAAQLETLAKRTTDTAEAEQLQQVAARTRLLCSHYKEAAEGALA